MTGGFYIFGGMTETSKWDDGSTPEQVVSLVV